MRPFLFLCCSAAVSGLFAPQAGIAQQRPPIFGFANKNRIPEVNKSGSPVFDKLRNEVYEEKAAAGDLPDRFFMVFPV